MSRTPQLILFDRINVTFVCSGKFLGEFKVVAIYETMLALDSLEYTAPQFLYVPNPLTHPCGFDVLTNTFTIFEENQSTKEANASWKLEILSKV